MDVDARVQLFDFKTKYQFQTTPGIDQYNMPMYDFQQQPGNQTIGMYPVYQGFSNSCYVNGVQVPFCTQNSAFQGFGPGYVQSLNPSIVADGRAANLPYTFNFPSFPSPVQNGDGASILAGHIDMAGIVAYGANVPRPLVSDFQTTIPTTSVFSAVYFTATDANGKNVVVADSGQFLALSGDGDLYGLLMTPGNAPLGNTPLTGGYSTTLNTINYNDGTAVVTFPVVIPSGNNIQVQWGYYQQGMPQSVMFWNNIIRIFPPPNISYLVELEAYLTPAAFLSTGSGIPFAYMCEYIARGAARKILADTGDVEQFAFYEPLFKEQETLVWKRSQRQFTATRTPTIFSEGTAFGNNFNSQGGP